MNRRTVLTSSATILAGLSGCVLDRRNDSRITINATQASCGEGAVDVDFDTRNTSDAVDSKLDAIVRTEQYTETPQYASVTTELFETLRKNFDGTSGTMKFNGSCYRVELHRIYDD